MAGDSFFVTLLSYFKKLQCVNIEIRIPIFIILYELGGLLMNKRWTKIAFCPHSDCVINNSI